MGSSRMNLGSYSASISSIRSSIVACCQMGILPAQLFSKWGFELQGADPAVGWVYYLHSYSPNGGLSYKELILLSDGYTTCTAILQMSLSYKELILLSDGYTTCTAILQMGV